MGNFETTERKYPNAYSMLAVCSYRVLTNGWILIAPHPQIVQIERHTHSRTHLDTEIDSQMYNYPHLHLSPYTHQRTHTQYTRINTHIHTLTFSYTHMHTHNYKHTFTNLAAPLHEHRCSHSEEACIDLKTTKSQEEELWFRARRAFPKSKSLNWA